MEDYSLFKSYEVLLYNLITIFVKTISHIYESNRRKNKKEKGITYASS